MAKKSRSPYSGVPPRHCQFCGTKFPTDTSNLATRRFCRGSRCANRWNAVLSQAEEGTPEWAAKLEAARARAAKRDSGYVQALPGTRLWSGEGQRRQKTALEENPRWKVFVEARGGERIAANEVNMLDVARELGWSSATVSRYYHAWAERVEREKANAEGRTPVVAIKALNDFSFFRRTYFRDHEGEPYVQAEHHVRWTDACMDTLETKGMTAILAPPRHGKTELLIHLVVWLILRNPNIRIIWIGGNADIAKQSLGAVKDELEHNERLREDFLREGEDFKPVRSSGKLWQADRFEVATRTQHGIKSPTMVAIGRGGKFLSRDADLVIGDDIIDHDSTVNPSTREDTKRWITTQVMSRREGGSAFFLIGSRQHHDDLYSTLLDNPMWAMLIESAHSPECTLPEHEYIDRSHTADLCDLCKSHVDCVLWPRKRPYYFLQQQRVIYDDETLFNMVYNNITRSENTQYVTWEDFQNCFDQRRVGELPRNREELLLIAGLDPSAAGDQAAFLWAYDVHNQERWAVDLDVTRAGGLPGARRVIEDWWERYQVGWWVIEKNNYQEAVIHDSEIRDFCARRGIKLTPTFTTGKNKHDPAMGVTGLMETFKHNPPITHIPAGDAETRAKFHQYGKQLVNFDATPHSRRTRRHFRDDIVMSSWFPELKFRPLTVEHKTRTRDTSTMSRMTYGPDRMGDAYTKMGVA